MTGIFFYFFVINFFFSLIWSVCATTDEEGRKKLDTFIREKETIFPIKDTIYDYYVDHANYCFASWQEKLPYGWRYETGYVSLNKQYVR